LGFALKAYSVAGQSLYHLSHNTSPRVHIQRVTCTKEQPLDLCIDNIRKKEKGRGRRGGKRKGRRRKRRREKSSNLKIMKT
jgi:hypothetical protein